MLGPPAITCDIWSKADSERVYLPRLVPSLPQRNARVKTNTIGIREFHYGR